MSNVRERVNNREETKRVSFYFSPFTCFACLLEQQHQLEQLQETTRSLYWTPRWMVRWQVERKTFPFLFFINIRIDQIILKIFRELSLLELACRF